MASKFTDVQTQGGKLKSIDHIPHKGEYPEKINH